MVQCPSCGKVDDYPLEDTGSPSDKPEYGEDEKRIVERKHPPIGTSKYFCLRCETEFD